MTTAFEAVHDITFTAGELADKLDNFQMPDGVSPEARFNLMLEITDARLAASRALRRLLAATVIASNADASVPFSQAAE